MAVSKHGLIDSSFLRRPHFDSRSPAAAVVRGTLVIPSEHCRPRDSRDSFGTLSSEGYGQKVISMAGLLGAIGNLTYIFSICTVGLAMDCKPDKTPDAAQSKGTSLIVEGMDSESSCE